MSEYQNEPIGDDEDVFGNLGLEDIPDQLPNREWPGYLVYGDLTAYKGNKRALSLKWRIHDPSSPFDGEVVSDFCPANPDDNARTKRKLTSRMELLGIVRGMSASKVREILTEKKGMAVTFKTYVSKDYVNVDAVKKRDDSISGQMKPHESSDEVVTPTGQAERDY